MTATIEEIIEVENKLPDVSGREKRSLVTTTAFSGLVTTTAFNTKIAEVENEISDYAKYITTFEFNKFC